MDTIDITLPVSQKIVTIRNYTTRADDAKSEAVLYVGVKADKHGNIDFPLENIMASTNVYVQRLVKEIDGDSNNIISRLDDLRSEDYEAIKVAVEEVVTTNSPKAKQTA